MLRHGNDSLQVTHVDGDASTGLVWPLDFSLKRRHSKAKDHLYLRLLLTLNRPNMGCLNAGMSACAWAWRVRAGKLSTAYLKLWVLTSAHILPKRL